MLNLDTHILLHALGDSLKPAELKLLRTRRWSISAVVLWEIAKLAQLGRIEVDLDDPLVVRTLTALHVWPITAEIAVMTTTETRPRISQRLIGSTSEGLTRGIV